jgi:tetratricopeptide (TPR) repeat protein
MKKATATKNRPSIKLPSIGGWLSVCSSGIIAAPRLSSQLESKHVTQSTSLQYAPLGLTTPPMAGSARAQSKHSTQTNRLIISISSLHSEVIARLSKRAETAYILRQLDEVESVCMQLEQVNAPVASYFRGLAAQRFGSGNLDHAQRLLEDAAIYAPRNYQARALLALGSIAEYQRDYKAETEFYGLALRVNQSDAFAAVETRRAIAIRLFAQGESERAIQLLESLLPLASTQPYLRGQLLNHLAVYYHQAGRLHDAVRLSELVCASPLAAIYHEWGETQSEIAEDLAEQEARAATVAVPKAEIIPQAFRREGKKESKGNSYPLKSSPHSEHLKPRVHCALSDLADSIQSRTYLCAPIHGPPSTFRK